MPPGPVLCKVVASTSAGGCSFAIARIEIARQSIPACTNPVLLGEWAGGTPARPKQHSCGRAGKFSQQVTQVRASSLYRREKGNTRSTDEAADAPVKNRVLLCIWKADFVVLIMCGIFVSSVWLMAKSPRKDKVAHVTGGPGGIGRATALALAR